MSHLHRSTYITHLTRQSRSTWGPVEAVLKQEHPSTGISIKGPMQCNIRTSSVFSTRVSVNSMELRKVHPWLVFFGSTFQDLWCHKVDCYVCPQCQKLSLMCFFFFNLFTVNRGIKTSFLEISVVSWAFHCEMHKGWVKTKKKLKMGAILRAFTEKKNRMENKYKLQKVSHQLCFHYSFRKTKSVFLQYF